MAERKRPVGVCRRCGLTWALNDDGKVRRHSEDYQGGPKCPGSRLYPFTAAELAEHGLTPAVGR